MGLFSKLEAAGTIEKLESAAPVTQNPVKTNSVGLLKKSMLLKTSGLDFFDFVQKYNFSHLAVFELSNDNFIITKSFGFNFESILKSVSTKTFWNGTIPVKEKWYFFQNLGLAPFYQFFEGHLKESINSIYIYFTSDDKILLIGSNDSSFKQPAENIVIDFQNLIPESKLTRTNFENMESDYFKCKITITELKLPDNIENYHFIDAVLIEIYSRLRLLLNTNLVKVYSSNSFLIAFNNPDNINITLLEKHILSTVNAFLNEQAHIYLDSFGNTNTIEDLISFMKVE